MANKEQTNQPQSVTSMMRSRIPGVRIHMICTRNQFYTCRPGQAPILSSYTAFYTRTRYTFWFGMRHGSEQDNIEAIHYPPSGTHATYRAHELVRLVQGADVARVLVVLHDVVVVAPPPCARGRHRRRAVSASRSPEGGEAPRCRACYVLHRVHCCVLSAVEQSKATRSKSWGG